MTSSKNLSLLLIIPTPPPPNNNQKPASSTYLWIKLLGVRGAKVFWQEISETCCNGNKTFVNNLEDENHTSKRASGFCIVMSRAS
jgi:hypothetical protein